MNADNEPLIPANMDPALPSPLTVEDVEELKHATLWSACKSIALESLKWGITETGRFDRIWARDLAHMAAVEESSVDKATLRSAIVEFFLFQEESGVLPGAVGDGAGTWPADQTRALPLDPGRVALFNGGGTSNELWLTLALCDYFKSTGDKSILQEIAAGRRMNQRVFDAMEAVFRESDRDEDGLILDRSPPSVGESCGQTLDRRVDQLRLNLNAVITLNAFIKLPDLRLEMVEKWIHRRKALCNAIRDVFWIEDECKLLPRMEEDTNAGSHRLQYALSFFALDTALAVEGGVLTSPESARSLATTMRVFHGRGLENVVPGAVATQGNLSKRTCPLVTATVARAYADSGFPGHAMEMLRGLAERGLREGGFCLGCPHRNQPKGAGHFRAASAAFLTALYKLGHPDLVVTRPISHHFAPPSASQPVPAAPSFGRVLKQRYTFKAIPYDEKRNLVRLNLEMPVEFHVKGGFGNGHKAIPGGILHPSETGLAIESKEALEEGAILEISVGAKSFGERKPFRLRGRVRWCKAKIASKLYLAGVELDARSKHLKRWRAFIKAHAEPQG